MVARPLLAMAAPGVFFSDTTFGLTLEIIL
jgi:hypothetical protein